MGYSFRINKQPDEKITFGVDFASDMGASELITGADVKAYDEDGVDVSLTYLTGSPSIIDGDQTDSVITQKVLGGLDGDKIKVTFKATTDAPHIFEADVKMTIRAI